jgi:hypothetical protein
MITQMLGDFNYAFCLFFIPGAGPPPAPGAPAVAFEPQFFYSKDESRGAGRGAAEKNIKRKKSVSATSPVVLPEKQVNFTR